METVIGFFVLFLFAVVVLPLVLVLVHSGRLRGIEATLKKLNDRIAALERDQVRPVERSVAEPAPNGAPVVEPPSMAPISTEPLVPPPLPVVSVSESVLPPPLPVTPEPVIPPPLPAKPAIDWEAFMGVKLFAWIGGFVLFLGVVFLVKYSFENKLITPSMQIALGGLIGLALILAGWV